MRKLLVFLLATAIMVGVLVVVNKPAPIPQPPQQQAVGPEKPIQPKIEPPIPPAPKIKNFEQAKAEIDESRIRKTIEFLCTPAQAGRMSGMKGNEASAKYIAEKFKEVGLDPGFSSGYFQSFSIRPLNEAKEKSSGRTANVVGVVPGGERCIVIGAHFDHIGYGPSMSRAPNQREIHPGADDNASSIGALLEIARAFSSLKGQLKHTVIIIAFSAEEMGLIGAEYYVNNPSVPLSKIDFMLNMDMIGRYKNTAQALGANATKELAAAFKEVPQNLNVRASASAGGGSDQAAFAQKGIPVVFMHTGMHDDYHTPSDTPDKLNYEGIKNIAQWTFHYCWVIDKQENLPRVQLFVPNGKWLDHDWEERK